MDGRNLRSRRKESTMPYVAILQRRMRFSDVLSIFSASSFDVAARHRFRGAIDEFRADANYFFRVGARRPPTPPPHQPSRISPPPHERHALAEGTIHCPRLLRRFAGLKEASRRCRLASFISSRLAKSRELPARRRWLDDFLLARGAGCFGPDVAAATVGARLTLPSARHLTLRELRLERLGPRLCSGCRSISAAPGVALLCRPSASSSRLLPPGPERARCREHESRLRAASCSPSRPMILPKVRNGSVTESRSPRRRD